MRVNEDGDGYGFMREQGRGMSMDKELACALIIAAPMDAGYWR